MPGVRHSSKNHICELFQLLFQLLKLIAHCEDQMSLMFYDL